jgi:hypothetical protein
VTRIFIGAGSLVLALALTCGPRNHAPEVPVTPIGPAYGLPDSVCAFSTSATDPDGDSVAIEFLWGDTAGVERTGFVGNGQPVMCSHVWREPGVFAVKARAVDARGRTSSWGSDVEIDVVHEDSLPLTPLRPEGPDSVRVGFIEEWSFPTRGPPGESLMLELDWGDGRTTTAFCRAAETVKVRQVFWTDGDWNVCAMVRDFKSQTSSPWSEAHLTKVRNSTGLGWQEVYPIFMLQSLAPTSDGNLIVTADDGYDHPLLLKVDQSGRVIWMRAYDTLDFTGLSVRQTSDGGFILAGTYLLSMNGGTHIARFDKNGEVLWYESYRGNTCGCVVSPTQDGGFIIGAGTALIKTDSCGDSLWKVKCGAWDVALTPDCGYVAFGQEVGPRLTRVDSGGEEVWSTSIGAESDCGGSIDRLPHGGYILTGDCSGGAALWRVNPSGSTVWSRVCGGPATIWAFDVRIAADGDFFVTGTCRRGAGDEAPFLARTDAQGHLKWRRLLCPSGWAQSVIPTQDNGCLVAGVDWQEEGAALWKVDENGGIGPEGYKAGAGSRGIPRTAQRARAERLRAAIRGR